MTTITNGSTLWTATLDHRTGATLAGGPASRYRRVARCDGRAAGAACARPNYAARRLGALLAVCTMALTGAWLVSEMAQSVVGQPVSAAEVASSGEQPSASPAADVHVARDGDTLWSIADEYRGEVARDRFIDALVTLNGDTVIRIGQAVVLP